MGAPWLRRARAPAYRLVMALGQELLPLPLVGQLPLHGAHVFLEVGHLHVANVEQALGDGRHLLQRRHLQWECNDDGTHEQGGSTWHVRVCRGGCRRYAVSSTSTRVLTTAVT